ncbi:histidine phosphatase family protein [Streptomyces sp. NPDC058195]|uniref:histidine phosphatase family protein n=1 Tax=Streptomyces sp. NPDC058195 TaxID=3346375 RepID=UPI0036E73C52
MTVRVMLIAPALNAALREARFDGDVPLDSAGVRRARAAAPGVPDAGLLLRGPSGRCAATAGALGLGLRTVLEPAVRGWDMGRWSGRRLDEVSAAEPAAVSAWLADPSAAPHGGESLLELCSRAGHWLESLGSGPDPEGKEVRVLAVVEPSVVRAATVAALALPPESFWRLDVAPLTLTTLSGRSGRWNLRCGQPLSPAPAD